MMYTLNKETGSDSQSQKNRLTDEITDGFRGEHLIDMNQFEYKPSEISSEYSSTTNSQICIETETLEVRRHYE